MWVALFSALLGALVGGFASSAGSLYVARADRRRAARERIMSDVLPATADVVRIDNVDPEQTYSAIGSLYRHAVTASAADKRQMKAAMDGLDRLRGAEVDSQWRTSSSAEQRSAWGRARVEHRQEIYDAIRKYSDWLEERMTRRFG